MADNPLVQLIVGDIGGTKTILATYRVEPRPSNEPPLDFAPIRVDQARFSSGDFESFNALLDAYLARTAHATEAALAVFGVAGPVVAGRCQTTNLPWELGEEALATRFGFATARLVNDFEAVAHGIGDLDKRDLVVLQQGEVIVGEPVGVLGAGTGLGGAVVVPSARDARFPRLEHRVICTEIGHTGFAPRDEAEIELLRDLSQRYGRVTAEHLLSGAGLSAIYDHLVGRGLAPACDAIPDGPLGERAPRIGECAVRGQGSACIQAVDLFLSIFGAKAGDFALSTMPYGGLFIAGGIASKLIERVQSGAFLEAFLDKAKMRSVVERMHLAVVVNEEVALIGARRLALSLLAEKST